MYIKALSNILGPRAGMLSIGGKGEGDEGGTGSDDGGGGGDDDAAAGDDDDDDAGDDDDDDDGEGDDDDGGEDDDDDGKSAKSKGKSKEAPRPKSKRKETAARRRTLSKDPDVQRMIKQASDKAVRDALAAQAAESEKKSKRANMEEADRLKAEKKDAETARDQALDEASEARVQLEFYREFSESGLQAKSRKAVEMIKQLAAEKVADDGVDWDAAIAEVAEEESYLFKDASASSSKSRSKADADDADDEDEEGDDDDDDDDEDDRRRAARRMSKGKGKGRSTTQGRGKRKTGAPAGKEPDKPKDAFEMSDKEWAAEKKRLGIH